MGQPWHLDGDFSDWLAAVSVDSRLQYSAREMRHESRSWALFFPFPLFLSFLFLFFFFFLVCLLRLLYSVDFSLEKGIEKIVRINDGDALEFLLFLAR